MGPHRASLRAIYFLSEEKTEAKLVTDGPICGFTVHLHVAAKPAQHTRVRSSRHGCPNHFTTLESSEAVVDQTCNTRGIIITRGVSEEFFTNNGDRQNRNPSLMLRVGTVANSQL